MPKHDAVYKSKMVKISLFRKNSLPYAMILFSILFELAYTVVILDDIGVSFMMGIITIINIILLFLLFTCAVKISTYRKEWAFVALLTGAYAVFRAFVIVPALKPVSKESNLIIYNLIMAALIITASIRSLILIRKRNAFLETEEAAYLLAKDIK